MRKFAVTASASISWTPRRKARLKDELFGRYMQVLHLDGDRKNDQLTSELRHFVDCVRLGRRPRVTGEDGRDALELAERILAAIRQHQWEGTPDGPVGPDQCPRPSGWLFLPPTSTPQRSRLIFPEFTQSGLARLSSETANPHLSPLGRGRCSDANASEQRVRGSCLRSQPLTRFANCIRSLRTTLSPAGRG